MFKSLMRKDGGGPPPSDGGRNATVDFKGGKRCNETHQSTTDPDARLYKKGDGDKSRLCYLGHALMESRNGLVVDATTTLASGTAERDAALIMVTTEGLPLGEITFQMPARKDVKARPVRQQLWARCVELPAGKGTTVSATCIVAHEIGAPPDATPVEWRLLTNRTVANDLEAVALIDWHRARWEIEMLFDVPKNACRVEALQLGTIEKLERALALVLVVACRIASRMRSGRTCPDLHATLFFDPDEIHSAYLLNDQDAPDKHRLNDVLRLVARLAGFLGRKSDGEPGVKTIWLGMKEVYVAAKTMGKLRGPANAKNCV